MLILSEEKKSQLSSRRIATKFRDSKIVIFMLFDPVILTFSLFRKSLYIPQVNADWHHICAMYEPMADSSYLNQTVSSPL